MNHTMKTVKLSTLTAGENPRIHMNTAGLIANIMSEKQLKVPISVWSPNNSNEYEIIAGHRRNISIKHIQENFPELFAEIFPDGIPVMVYSDITPDEAVDLKLDHADQLSLADPHELQRSANMLFRCNNTEADVSVKLATLIDTISPMKAKNREKLDGLERQRAEAEEVGLKERVADLVKEIKEYVANYRRGFTQNLHNIFRCPDVVMQALERNATGRIPEGCTEPHLPTLTNAQVKALWKAHSKDLEIIEGGLQVYNRRKVGPHFSAKWAEIVKADQEPKSETTPSKAMSGKDMKAELEGGKYLSEVGVLLTNHHAGVDGVDPSKLEEADKASYLADLVRNHMPDVWEMVVESAKEVEDKLIEANKEKAEAA